jgi:hypothetical protein
MTCIDQDGTQATAISHIHVGNLYAGITSRLSLASFTSEDPAATAADFSATITWGDGSAPTAGTVAGGNGSFYVTGFHTYLTDGTYTVAVAVTDSGGSALNFSSTVVVVPAPLTGYTANLTDIAGQSLAGATAAIVTTQNPYVALSDISASTEMQGSGMGTTSGTVTGGTGMFPILSSFAYLTFGLYRPQIEVLWSQVVEQLALLSTAMVSSQVPLRVTGPPVVPDLSEYVYRVDNPGKAEVKWSMDGNLQQAAAGTPNGDTYTVKYRRVAAPVYGQVRATVGQTDAKPLDVAVVQVIVRTPDPKSEFAHAQEIPPNWPDKLFKNGGALKPGEAYQSTFVPNLLYTIRKGGNEIRGKGEFANLTSKDSELPGMAYWADIELRGPTVGNTRNFGVNKITVGFIQFGTVTKQRAYYSDKTGESTLVYYLEGRKDILDTEPSRSTPWYYAGPTFTGHLAAVTPEKNRQIIWAEDGPNGAAPKEYDGKQISKIELVWNFALNVDAESRYTAFEVDENGKKTYPDPYNKDKYFRQASAGWAFDATGTFQPGGAFGLLWLTPDKQRARPIQISPPGPGDWKPTNELRAESTGGPMMNRLLGDLIYVAQ